MELLDLELEKLLDAGLATFFFVSSIGLKSSF